MVQKLRAMVLPSIVKVGFLEEVENELGFLGRVCEGVCVCVVGETVNGAAWQG